MKHILKNHANPLALLLMALTMALTFLACEEKGKGAEGGTFTDARDGKIYKTVKIGEQVWMAENLNYNAKNSKCYDDGPANCDQYGRLYDWATAMNLPASCNSTSCASQINAKHRGICPQSWHIPNASDWDILMEYVQINNGSTYALGNNASIAGTHLKATNGWNKNGNGEDTYGFAALPGGYRGGGNSYFSVGSYGTWLSSNEYDKESIRESDDGEYLSVYVNDEVVYCRTMYDGEVKRTDWTQCGKESQSSVRCVKD